MQSESPDEGLPLSFENFMKLNEKVAGSWLSLKTCGEGVASYVVHIVKMKSGIVMVTVLKFNYIVGTSCLPA